MISRNFRRHIHTQLILPKRILGKVLNVRFQSSPAPLPAPNKHMSLSNLIKIFGTTAICAGLFTFASTIGLSSHSDIKIDTLLVPTKHRLSITDSDSKPLFPNGTISVIFVLGGPGVGKGTQCQKLVQNGFIHLSAGDLLRAEQERKGSQYGGLIAQCITEGTIVPQHVTLELLKKVIKEHYDQGSNRFLIDGFPRKMDQALSFENQIASSSFSLFFECPEHIMLERLLQRGKNSGRADDNIESIKKRFHTFIDTSMPVVEHYEKLNKVVKVRCDQPVEDVHHQVMDAIAEMGA